MKFKARSFPHPVLGSGDDIQDAAFQVIFEAPPDRASYRFDSRYQLSHPTLLELIAQERAAYVMHVECGSTFFRRRYRSFATEAAEVIAADDLREAVEVNHFVVAVEDISGYRPEGSHPDYGDAAFDVRKGDILAVVVPGRRFSVEKEYDSLQPSASILQVETSQEQEGPMKVDLNEDKIRVILSKTDYANYVLLKAVSAMSPVLHSAIVLPALVEAFNLIGSKEATEDELEGRRWYRGLMSSVEKNPAAVAAADSFTKAQAMLDRPLSRTLASLLPYAER